MQEKELTIIKGAAAVFMKYGIKAMNMDDISKNLGISKKTLYKYVSDKNDLVRKAMVLHGVIEDATIGEICAKGLNAIDESFEMSKFITNMLNQVHPSIHFDMEKYHPEVFHEMMTSRQESIYKCVSENLEKGKSEGLYRSNINSDIITKIYLTKMDAMFDSQVFPPEQVSFTEVYLEFFRYHIRGIASEKGREYLKEKLKKEL